MLALNPASSSPIQFHLSPILPLAPVLSTTTTHPPTPPPNRSSLVSVLQNLAQRLQAGCKLSSTHGAVSWALPGSCPQRSRPRTWRGGSTASRGLYWRGRGRREPSADVARLQGGTHDLRQDSVGSVDACGVSPEEMWGDPAGLTDRESRSGALTSQGKGERLRQPSSPSASTTTFQYVKLSRQATSVVEKSAKTFVHLPPSPRLEASLDPILFLIRINLITEANISRTFLGRRRPSSRVASEGWTHTSWDFRGTCQQRAGRACSCEDCAVSVSSGPHVPRCDPRYLSHSCVFSGTPFCRMFQNAFWE